MFYDFRAWEYFVKIMHFDKLSHNKFIYLRELMRFLMHIKAVSAEHSAVIGVL